MRRTTTEETVLAFLLTRSNIDVVLLTLVITTKFSYILMKKSL